MAKYLQKQLRDNIANKKYLTERLARTESAKVEFQIQHATAKKQGFDYVKWHAEPNACPRCLSISVSSPTKYGEGIYNIDDVPEIPQHPNCRCSISTYVAREE